MRSLTSEECTSLRQGDLVNVKFPGGEIFPLLFVSFAAGGLTGDTFAHLFFNGKLIAVDPERLLTPER